MNTEASPIGVSIKQQRQQRGVTQRALCEAVEISENYLSQIENGRRLPSFETLGRISEYLDMDAPAIEVPAALRADLIALVNKHDIRDIRRALREVLGERA